MPPGQNMDDFLTIIRSGMWRLSYQLSREGRKRFFDEFLPLLNDTKGTPNPIPVPTLCPISMLPSS